MSSSPVKAGGARTRCSTSITAALSWYSIALGGMDPARSLSLQRGMDGASLQLSLFIVLRRRAPCDTPHRQVINCRDIYKQLNKLALGGVGHVRVSSGSSTATGWDSAGTCLRPTASSRSAGALGTWQNCHCPCPCPWDGGGGSISDLVCQTQGLVECQA